jgi:CheY-like chemotaxis protein
VTVRVLLVDDLPEVRRRIRAALRRHRELVVVGEVDATADAFESARRLQPDVVVLDTSVPELAGRQVLSRLREDVPHAKVVVFSGVAPEHSDDVDGYVQKDEQIEYLIDLLETLGRAAGPLAALRLPCALESARCGRDFARDTLTRWHVDELVGDAVLIVSELVSNAVVHARCPCELRLLLGDAAVRIEVDDSGVGTPDPLPASSTRPFGRGLNLIDAMTSAWGVEPRTGGKVVWAELPRQVAAVSSVS